MLKLLYLTLNMCVFGLRNSAYAVNLTYGRHTNGQHISPEISIEHSSVGLASLAQLHTLYYTLHTEHAYCFSYLFMNNVVITTVIEMVEMVEILNGRLGKRSIYYTWSL